MDAVADVQATLLPRLQQVIPSDNQRPVRVWASDESRFGLHTIRRRRITRRGITPIGLHQHRFENTWAFGAVEPRSGARHVMEFPTLNTVMMQQFLAHFAATYAESLNVVIVDNARSHTAKTLIIPANVVLVFQPPYSPEVNPCERVWQAIKARLAWDVSPTLADLRQRLVAVFRTYSDAHIQSLTSYPYILDAANALAA